MATAQSFCQGYELSQIHLNGLGIWSNERMNVRFVVRGKMLRQNTGFGGMKAYRNERQQQRKIRRLLD